jgi:hypothetical protein
MNEHVMVIAKVCVLMRQNHAAFCLVERFEHRPTDHYTTRVSRHREGHGTLDIKDCDSVHVAEILAVQPDLPSVGSDAPRHRRKSANGDHSHQWRRPMLTAIDRPTPSETVSDDGNLSEARCSDLKKQHHRRERGENH